ncbi:unnamed protein product [Amoebophrya sp. A120]|nr:unnamed protein product [Amoebophrya sp. A120]|eukprot:GSA120T00009075001.1
MRQLIKERRRVERELQSRHNRSGSFSGYNYHSAAAGGLYAKAAPEMLISDVCVLQPVEAVQSSRMLWNNPRCKVGKNGTAAGAEADPRSSCDGISACEVEDYADVQQFRFSHPKRLRCRFRNQVTIYIYINFDIGVQRSEKIRKVCEKSHRVKKFLLLLKIWARYGCVGNGLILSGDTDVKESSRNSSFRPAVDSGSTCNEQMMNCNTSCSSTSFKGTAVPAPGAVGGGGHGHGGQQKGSLVLFPPYALEIMGTVFAMQHYNLFGTSRCSSSSTPSSSCSSSINDTDKTQTARGPRQKASWFQLLSAFFCYIVDRGFQKLPLGLDSAGLGAFLEQGCDENAVLEVNHEQHDPDAPQKRTKHQRARKVVKRYLHVQDPVSNEVLVLSSKSKFYRQFEFMAKQLSRINVQDFASQKCLSALFLPKEFSALATIEKEHQQRSLSQTGRRSPTSRACSIITVSTPSDLTLAPLVEQQQTGRSGSNHSKNFYQEQQQEVELKSGQVFEATANVGGNHLGTTTSAQQGDEQKNGDQEKEPRCSPLSTIEELRSQLLQSGAGQGSAVWAAGADSASMLSRGEVDSRGFNINQAAPPQAGLLTSTRDVERSSSASGGFVPSVSTAYSRSSKNPGSGSGPPREQEGEQPQGRREEEPVFVEKNLSKNSSVIFPNIFDSLQGGHQQRDLEQFYEGCGSSTSGLLSLLSSPMAGSVDSGERFAAVSYSSSSHLEQQLQQEQLARSMNIKAPTSASTTLQGDLRVVMGQPTTVVPGVENNDLCCNRVVDEEKRKQVAELEKLLKEEVLNLKIATTSANFVEKPTTEQGVLKIAADDHNSGGGTTSSTRTGGSGSATATPAAAFGTNGGGGPESILAIGGRGGGAALNQDESSPALHEDNINNLSTSSDISPMIGAHHQQEGSSHMTHNANENSGTTSSKGGEGSVAAAPGTTTGKKGAPSLPIYPSGKKGPPTTPGGKMMKQGNNSKDHGKNDVFNRKNYYPPRNSSCYKGTGTPSSRCAKQSPFLGVSSQQLYQQTFHHPGTSAGFYNINTINNFPYSNYAAQHYGHVAAPDISASAPSSWHYYNNFPLTAASSENFYLQQSCSTTSPGGGISPDYYFGQYNNSTSQLGVDVSPMVLSSATAPTFPLAGARVPSHSYKGGSHGKKDSTANQFLGKGNNCSTASRAKQSKSSSKMNCDKNYAAAKPHDRTMIEQDLLCNTALYSGHDGADPYGQHPPSMPNYCAATGSSASGLYQEQSGTAPVSASRICLAAQEYCDHMVRHGGAATPAHNNGGSYAGSVANCSNQVTPYRGPVNSGAAGDVDDNPAGVLDHDAADGEDVVYDQFGNVLNYYDEDAHEQTGRSAAAQKSPFFRPEIMKNMFAPAFNVSSTTNSTTNTASTSTANYASVAIAAAPRGNKSRRKESYGQGSIASTSRRGKSTARSSRSERIRGTNYVSSRTSTATVEPIAIGKKASGSAIVQQNNVSQHSKGGNQQNHIGTSSGTSNGKGFLGGQKQKPHKAPPGLG